MDDVDLAIRKQLVERARYWLDETDGTTSIEDSITYDLISDLLAELERQEPEAEAEEAARKLNERTGPTMTDDA